ncbi:MAG: hypothetical protein EGQ85_08810 [Faecalibacterium prausnitzii]|nr:hypothetical protein [Faecalibacterium prausnitzii]
MRCREVKVKRRTIQNARRVALGIFSGRIILNFGISERLRAFRYPIFTREKGPRSVRRRSGGRNHRYSFR